MTVSQRFAGVQTPEQVANGFRAIGRFITATSDLDMMLTALLANVLRMESGGQEFVMRSIDFNRKREIIRAIGTIGAAGTIEKGPKPFDEILKLVDKADKLMGVRNIVAHGMFTTHPTGQMLVGMSIPAIAKHVRKKSEMVDVETLDGLSDQADRISLRFAEMIETVEAARAKVADSSKPK
jgi:hypothetical protein